MSPAPQRPRRPPEPSTAEPSLATGILAALPLFAAYELALLALSGTAAHEPAQRVPAERIIAGILEPLAAFGIDLGLARAVALAAATALAWTRLRRAPDAAARARRVPREIVEGCVAGVLFGPLLVLLVRALDLAPLAILREPARSLPWMLRLAGGAPWEELLFRVGAYGLLFLAARRALAFLGLESRAAALAAELAGLLGSALLFAAFHLDAVQRLLGLRGEPFHAGLFTWHLSAGILLGGFFRWRGFGAVSWAHALFNLGLALGVRPA